MKVSEYLSSYQPIADKCLKAAFLEKRVSHAYLLVGEAGTPLKETAFYMAKSLVCLNPSPLADESCKNCERIDHGTYSDFIFLNGADHSIKKEEIENIIANFSKTPNEVKGIMVYVINLVENMTADSVNSLLKFLEEPSPNTYAILTTQNISKVLPTIVSRSETIRLVLRPREDVIKEAIEEGASQEDAEILSFFANSPSLILEEAETDEYKKAKHAFSNALRALLDTRSGSLYYFESMVLPFVSSKEEARYFLDMLSLAYKDLINLSIGQKVLLASYDTLLRSLKDKCPSPTKALREILAARGELDININVALLLEHLVITLSEEY
jgi:DNA polymerase-3 subunit delta'